MAASDSRPIPRKNVAYRVYLPILDADGDLVTGATGLDSEVSIDGGTFADCTNEATEVATASGIYFLDLTAAEMNGDAVCVIVKTTTVGAKTTPVVLYPEEVGDVRIDASTLATSAALATAQADLDDIQARIPAALVSGRIDASVGAVAAGAITAASIATDAIDADALAADAGTEIGTAVWASGTRALTDKAGFSLSAAGIQAVWDVLTSALTTVGSVGKRITDNLDATVSSRLATAGYTVPPAVGAIADGVWDEALAGHAAAGSAGEALSAAGTAGDPWTTALPGAYGVGTAGKIVGDNLNATVGSRSSHSAADVWAVGTRALTDKAGFSLSAAGVQAVWDALTSALTTVGSVGKLLADNLNATISSRASQASVDTVDDLLDTEIVAIKAKTDTLPASPAATGDIPSAATIAGAVWDEDATAHQTQGTFGQALGDPVADANTIYGAVVTGAAGATVAADVVAVQADTDNLQTRLPAALVGGRIDASVGAMAADVLTASALAADAVDEILDEQIGDSTITMRQAMRVLLAGMAGKLSGAATTTITIRNVADTANVVVATVDADGNRSAVTVTP